MDPDPAKECGSGSVYRRVCFCLLVHAAVWLSSSMIIRSDLCSSLLFFHSKLPRQAFTNGLYRRAYNQLTTDNQLDRKNIHRSVVRPRHRINKDTVVDIHVRGH